MVKSLLHPVGDHYSASNATFAIIRGKSVSCILYIKKTKTKKHNNQHFNFNFQEVYEFMICDYQYRS